MHAALRYLLVRSFINGIVSRLARLRQPKYLLTAILGAAYFYFYFYKFLFGRGFSGSKMGAAMALSDTAWPVVGAAVLLVCTILFSWILPASRAAITFTEAEIAFLFPAPISRKRLIVHKLLRSQLAFLFIAVIATFLTGRFRAGPEAWFRVTGWWIILNTLSMHRIAASFALQRLGERGMTDWKRRVGAVFALGGLVAVVEVTRRSLPDLPSLALSQGQTAPNIAGIITQLSEAGPLPYILAPFRWVMGPYFAHDPRTFLLTLGPAVGIMALHFLWVLRADVSFEEASIVASQKRAALVEARHKGEIRVKSHKARSPVWRLRPTGFAPMAFLWKSLIKFGGRRALALWASVFVILGSGALFIYNIKVTGAKLPQWGAIIAALVAIGCYGTILLTFIMVGQSATANLRQGLTSISLLKTYPIPGWQLALGELAGPLLLGSCLQWCALAIGGLLACALVPSGTTPVVITGAVLAMVLPAFNVSMSILPCGAALMFPGWFKPQEKSNQGLEGMGLRLIVGISQLAAMAAILVPVAFFGCCVWFIAAKWTTSILGPAAAAGIVGTAVLTLECALGVAWLGSLYEEYEGVQS